VGQARAEGCQIYEKTNLLYRIREYPGQAKAESINVHEAFDMGYLQRDVLAPNDYNPQEIIDKGIAFKG
jgi:hypothetical protein